MQLLRAPSKTLPIKYWRRCLPLFAGIFLATLLLQFGIFWYQLRAAVWSDINRYASQIANILSYSERWDLTPFRQGELFAPHCFVIDANGLLIYMRGFFPQLQIHVAPTTSVDGLQTVNVPKTGESWRILVHRLRDGIVILGVSPPADITHVDDRLIENAKHFGDSIAEAVRVKTAMIDKTLDYVLIDATGRLLAATGGIPLKVIDLPNLVPRQMNEITPDNGQSYGIMTMPFIDQSAHDFGKIFVFDEMPPKPWHSWRAWVLFLLSSSVLALMITFFRDKIRATEKQIATDDLASRIGQGETKNLEFKSSLRWNSFKQGFDKEIENAALKAIVAFCNTDGGELLIGVADDGGILGIESDAFANSDKFLLHLRNLIMNRIGANVFRLVDYKAVPVEGKVICQILCKPSNEPVWLKSDKSSPEQFFVRYGPSSTELKPKEAVAYIQNHFKKIKN
jgi:hypothetical protein